MRLTRNILTTALAVAVSASALALPARAQIGPTPVVAPAARSLVQTVQYRYYGGGRRYYGGGNGVGAAVAGGILGLAAGAAIAGAANSAPPPVAGPNLADPNFIAYCARKYRSFDPSTGTFLANDGMRYYCQ